MADKKISALTAATVPLAGTEVLPIVQGGSTVKVPVSDLTAGRAVSGASFTTTVGNYVAKNDYGLSFGAGDTYIWGSTVGAFIRLDVNYVTAFSVNSARNATVNVGNLVIGTAGKGIDFSANTHAAGMTSELLNWYEEGTWTPATFTNWSTAPTSILAAKYTRIGRLVTLNVLGYEGIITGSGIIAGLPFAVDTSGGSLTIQDVAGAGVTSFGIVEGGSSRISGLTAANYTGKYWHFSCSYIV